MTLNTTKETQFEIRFREQMATLSSPFSRGIMQKNTQIILDNMRLISDIIIQVDARELVAEDANILAMALTNDTAKRILLAARGMNKYFYWDNEIIYDMTVSALLEHRIALGPKGQAWLMREIQRFQRFLCGPE